MDILSFLLAFLAGFITIIILDYLWLWRIIHDFIKSEFDELVSIREWTVNISLFYWLLAWAVIVFGCLFFVVIPSDNFLEVLWRWAIFWFVLYFTYDFTNLTFIKNYPIRFALIDVLWWSLLCSLISLACFLVFVLL